MYFSIANVKIHCNLAFAQGEASKYICYGINSKLCVILWNVLPNFVRTMTHYTRKLNIQLPIGQSCFLWGPRKTGKTHYLVEHYPDSFSINLLKSETFFRYLKQPELLRHDIAGLDPQQLVHPIIIDEVQKIPILLDEIHNLIESTDAYFILCGSSARKLKITGANLLGGRAWRYQFFPLIYQEIPDFDLLTALNHGMVPSHYLATYWRKTIKAYIYDYLKEEIQMEGLTRNLKAFAEFLDLAAFNNAQLINYSNNARDCGIDVKTIKEYYQILVDTLLGYFVKPYAAKTKRDDLVAMPKFYFFDVGVVNGLTKRSINILKGAEAGDAFEHFILMELMAYRGLNDLDFDISFWRTNRGLEVDFILGQAKIALEIKISDTVKLSELKGLAAFCQEYKKARSIVVCQTPVKQKYALDGSVLEVWPWQEFLDELWAGEFI